MHHCSYHISPEYKLKASFTLSRFSVPASLRCGHRCPPGPYRSDAGKHRIESGYTVLNRHSPGSCNGGFNYFKTTETHRDAPGYETAPAYSGAPRSASGMNRIFTVKTFGRNRSKRLLLIGKTFYEIRHFLKRYSWCSNESLYT